MDDKTILEHIQAGILIGKLQANDKQSREAAELIGPAIQRAIERLETTERLQRSVGNLSEDLAVERMSNKRMRDLLADLAVALPGNPANYPHPICDLTRRIHREVGTIQ